MMQQHTKQNKNKQKGKEKLYLLIQATDILLDWDSCRLYLHIYNIDLGN